MTLSIVTINYNNLEGLRKTIDSVLSQTWHDYEWIIIDGGSSDGSHELIEETAARLQQLDFNPLTYWCSEPDKGIYNAMNKGITHCNGEYVNFMNSGDEYTNEQVHNDIFKQKLHGDIVYGDWYEKYADKTVLRSIDANSILLSLKEMNICHQATFYKTSILKEKGFDENFKYLSDWARNTEELFKGTKFQHLCFPVCYYDMSGFSNNAPKDVLSSEYELIWSKCPEHITYLLNIINLCNKDYYISNAIKLLHKRRLYNFPLRLVIKILSSLL